MPSTSQGRTRLPPDHRYHHRDRRSCLSGSHHLDSCMSDGFPHISTIMRARRGLALVRIRAAATVLAITEQGLRNRPLASRRAWRRALSQDRPRRLAVLTDAGRRFLSRAHRSAPASVPRPRGGHRPSGGAGRRQPAPDLIPAHRRPEDFAKTSLNIHVRASTMNERDVEDAVMSNPAGLQLAAAAEQSPDWLRNCLVMT